MPINEFDLTGRVALVTGCSRGLGQVFARALADAGADLIITSRKVADLAGFQSEIEALGRKCLSLTSAMSVDHPSILAMVESAHAEWGKNRHPRQQRRMQHPQTCPRSDVGGLEPDS